MNIHKAGEWFIVPIALCQYAIEKKLIRELQLLVAMKTYSSGRVVWNQINKTFLSERMGVTVRTLELTIKSLVDLKWVNRYENVIFLRKFDFIIALIEGRNCTGFYYFPDDLIRFKAFILGGVIGYLAKIQQIRQRGEVGARFSKKWENISTASTSLITVSNIGLSKILNCSLSQAYQYKKLAAKYNYITIKSNFKVLDHIKPQYLRYYKKSVPEKANTVRIKDGKVVEQLSDIVYPNLKYKVRKKSKHI